MAQQTWSCLLLLLLSCHCLLSTSLEIHPYAFAADQEEEAELPSSSFLEDSAQIVKPLLKGSPEAESLLAVAETATLEATATTTTTTTATETEGRRSRRGFLGGLINTAKNVLFGPKGDPNNPADPTVAPLHPNPSPFTKDPRSHGTFPGNDQYRRAVYGPRRRRMPYSTSYTFGSVNPYRRPNDFHRVPMDFLFPRDRFYLAMHPEATDMGKLGPSGVFPYGDYSSFTPNHHLWPGLSDYRNRGRAMFGDLGETSINFGVFPMLPWFKPSSPTGKGGKWNSPHKVAKGVVGSGDDAGAGDGSGVKGGMKGGKNAPHQQKDVGAGKHAQSQAPAPQQGQEAAAPPAGGAPPAAPAAPAPQAGAAPGGDPAAAGGAAPAAPAAPAA